MRVKCLVIQYNVLGQGPNPACQSSTLNVNEFILVEVPYFLNLETSYLQRKHSAISRLVLSPSNAFFKSDQNTIRRKGVKLSKAHFDWSFCRSNGLLGIQYEVPLLMSVSVFNDPPTVVGNLTPVVGKLLLLKSACS